MQLKYKVSLSKKLFLSLILVSSIIIITVISTINIIFKEKFHNYVENSKNKEISNMINSIKTQYNNGTWNSENIDTIGINSIYRGWIIELYDKNDNLVWSTLQHGKLLSNKALHYINHDMQNIEKFSNDNRYKIKVYNLKDSEGNYIGKLELGSYDPYYYDDEELNLLSELNTSIILISILISILTFILSLIISRKISNPIKKVSKASKFIANGKYNKAIDYESDIKEIDELVKSINYLSDELHEQDILRKRLTTDISHELRTPLTCIKLHIDALIDGIWEPSTDRLTSINEEVTRITNLVEELKSLAKYDSEERILNLSIFNLKNLISNIIYNNEGKAYEKNIIIKSSLEDIDVCLDKEKITQLILNLLSNAIRYTENNGYIYIKAYKCKNSIKIHIKDNGIGIPKDNLKYIFERFYRVDSSRSRDTGGIGVGLTICKSIVDLHKGIINVKSEEGLGSEFIVELPILVYEEFEDELYYK